jgi:ribosomal protein S9
VGWSDLIWRRSPRVKPAVVDVAASIAEAIVQSTNLLRTRLTEEGFAWTDPARADSDDCLLECTILEWFIRDVAVSGGFGSQTEAIRRALAGRILIDLQRSGVWAACLADFDRRYRERFTEYSDALDVSSSLQSLGALAWRRISGGDRPSERMTMLLAIRVRAELAGLIASGRALVTGASDERRSSTATPVREAPSSG